MTNHNQPWTHDQRVAIFFLLAQAFPLCEWEGKYCPGGSLQEGYIEFQKQVGVLAGRTQPAIGWQIEAALKYGRGDSAMADRETSRLCYDAAVEAGFIVPEGALA